MTAEQNLVQWSRGMAGRPFIWGETDCAMLALRAIDAMRGTAHAKQYAHRWTTEDAALAHFATETPSSVLQSIGGQEVDPRYASVGDVLTVPAGKWPEQLVVVMGRLALCADIERGVCLLLASHFTERDGARAWRFA